MKRGLLIYTAAALAVLAAVSCKKDDDTTETKPYLYGVTFDLPTFARPGDILTLTAYGVYTGDGGDLDDITYKWRVNSEAFQEMDIFTLIVEEVGNYAITCQASDPDDNYYSTSTTKNIIVIDPALGKTLTGTGISAEDIHVTDLRDQDGENDYFIAENDGLEWFRNNLAYTGSGLAYENADVTSYPLGRYYTWDEAVTACPEGWRLPTLEEWEGLGDEAGALMCDAYLNSKQMWEYWPNVPKDNTLGMAVIPSGYALAATTSPSYKRIYDYAAFWTATGKEGNASMAAFRYLYVQDNEVRTGYGDKASLALSVRCVR